jgi:diguanylate cyclase (GGDEF)-like protein/PAS domain S-box-containing protein
MSSAGGGMGVGLAAQIRHRNPVSPPMRDSLPLNSGNPGGSGLAGWQTFATHINAMSAATRFSLGIAVLTGIAYYCLASTAIVMTRLSGGIALIWFANGVLLPALCLLRSRLWWPTVVACLVASAAATLTFNWSPLGAAEFAVANVLEGALAAAMMRRLHICRDPLADLRSLLLFAGVAGLFAPALSGVFGAIAAGTTYDAPFARSWAEWCAGHGLGMVITAPFVMLFPVRRILRDPDDKPVGRPPHPGTPRQLLGTATALLLVAATTVAVFAQTELPLLFLPALPMLIAAFSLGRTGAAGSLMLIAVIAGFATATGDGPVAGLHGTSGFRFQFVQFYLATLFLMALPAAAILNRQRRLYARLKASEQVLRHVTEHSDDILVGLDNDGVIRYASPSIARVGGHDPAALVGRSAGDLVDADYREDVWAAQLRAIREPGETVTVEYLGLHADGERDWFESNIRAVVGQDGIVTGTVSAIRNVGHRKQIEASLRSDAETDPLTGLPNRRGLEAALRRAVREAAGGRPTVLAVFDLDHFKSVNDNWGHPAGDAVLRVIGELCVDAVRTDDFPARIGGEEFAILFHDATLTDATAIVERLRQTIQAQPILAPGAGKLLHVTASFGLAAVDGQARPAAVLAAADRALYAAKDAGRNRLSVAA